MFRFMTNTRQCAATVPKPYFATVDTAEYWNGWLETGRSNKAFLRY